VGDVRDGGLIHDRADDRQLDCAEDLSQSFRDDAQYRTRNLEIPGLVLAHHPGMTIFVASPPAVTIRYFGCGTIRIYGFGDFQPAG